jgi:hypothetical protein
MRYYTTFCYVKLHKYVEYNLIVIILLYNIFNGMLPRENQVASRQKSSCPVFRQTENVGFGDKIDILMNCAKGVEIRSGSKTLDNIKYNLKNETNDRKYLR